MVDFWMAVYKIQAIHYSEKQWASSLVTRVVKAIDLFISSDLLKGGLYEEFQQNKSSTGSPPLATAPYSGHSQLAMQK